MTDETSELRALTQALRAHIEWQAATGATGVKPASPELRAERGAVAPPALPAEDPVSAQPVASSRPGGQTQQAPRKQAPAPPAAVPPEARVLAPEERVAALSVIQAEVEACEACGLHTLRANTVFARGNGSVGVCFVGEGPGAEEDAQGLPFVGKAGQLLDKMIAAMGLDRNEVYVANIVKCRPPKNRKPEPDEMQACRGYLERQLDILQPAVIVALGATAVQGLLGTSQGITRLRGNWKLYQGRTAVMPTFHPAYLLRNPRAKRDVWEDLKAVLRHMGRPLPEKKSS